MYIYSYLSGLAAAVRVIILMKDSNASDVKPLLETVLVKWLRNACGTYPRIEDREIKPDHRHQRTP